MFKRTLVTSALPYANGPVHIGHLAGVYVPADIYVRYLRLKGEEVLFVGGSDEHGVPVTIRARKELTDEWKTHGIQKGKEYAILTDEITEAWSGMTTRKYKNLKGLKSENLRDNMSTLELALNMLAEATTTELTRVQNPQGLAENQVVARQGGGIAGDARKQIETQTGRPVVTSANATTLYSVVTQAIEGVAQKENDKKDGGRE